LEAAIGQRFGAPSITCDQGGPALIDSGKPAQGGLAYRVDQGCQLIDTSGELGQVGGDDGGGHPAGGAPKAADGISEAVGQRFGFGGVGQAFGQGVGVGDGDGASEEHVEERGGVAEPSGHGEPLVSDGPAGLMVGVVHVFQGEEAQQSSPRRAVSVANGRQRGVDDRYPVGVDPHGGAGEPAVIRKGGSDQSARIADSLGHPSKDHRTVRFAMRPRSPAADQRLRHPASCCQAECRLEGIRRDVGRW
jgi:hypothetical protein